MVRFILISLLLLSFSVRADFLGFKTGAGFQSKIPELAAKLKALEMENTPAYEDQFNQLVKAIENSIEEEKLLCSGETADVEGKILPKEQRQLCFRALKGHYLEAVETIFNLKKKYLGLIHTRQMERLTEIQKKHRADIEKSF